MGHPGRWMLGGLLGALLAAPAFLIAEPPVKAGKDAAVVGNIKVLTDAAEDVSSIEAWASAVCPKGMPDKDRVFKAWEAVVKYRHHDAHPREFLGMGSDMCNDAIKLFNCYGYCSGVGAQCAFLQLLRGMGIEARAWSIYKWGVVEAFYDGGWHYFDPGMICYYTKPDGAVAGVEEIAAGLKAWYAAHPDYLDQDAKMRAFMKDPGIAQGPEILRTCPTLDAGGSYPLNYFGWYTTMLIFNGMNNTPFPYEENHTQGHRVNATLRKGEKITRNWSNTGKFVNAAEGGAPECLNLKVGSGAIYYTPKFGDRANGRIGSGTIEYVVPLDTRLSRVLLESANLALSDTKGSPVKAKDPAQPAVMVFDRASGYVYLTGTLTLDAVLKEGGQIGVEVSVDNGRTWKPAATVTAAGTQTVDLTPLVLRQYDYRVKLTLTGKETALTGIRFANDIQVSQRALPALVEGANKVRFSTGTAEGTVTVQGTSPRFKDKQPSCEDMGVVFENVDVPKMRNEGFIIPSGAGTVTVPLEAPGDILRLRFGCQCRAGSAGEGWNYQVSFDDGKSFTTVDAAMGPVRNTTKYITFDKIPAGTKKALVRFTAVPKGNLVMFGFRCDADYTLPGGGFMPVKVTYTWDENGTARTDEHIAKKAEEEYTITCGVKPVMKAITLEVAE
jgi:hypothetical protein